MRYKRKVPLQREKALQLESLFALQGDAGKKLLVILTRSLDAPPAEE
jgi:hypothetical protein